MPKSLSARLAAACEAVPQPGDPCLSIRQPWPALILAGIKRIENRSRNTHFRGRLWIHASSGPCCIDSWSELYETVNGRRVQPDEELTTPEGITLPALVDLPARQVVGSVEVYDSLEVEDLDFDALVHDPHALGPWCWMLRDPRALSAPVAAKGALGIWHWK